MRVEGGVQQGTRPNPLKKITPPEALRRVGWGASDINKIPFFLAEVNRHDAEFMKLFPFIADLTRIEELLSQVIFELRPDL